MRVFSDRLIDEQDKEYFKQECLNINAGTFFKEEDLKNADNIIFCNFVDPNIEDEAVYQESKSAIDLRDSLTKIIE